MVHFRLSVGFVVLLGLVACVEPGGKTSTVLPVPPEYLKCKSVPTELAKADANVLKLGVYNTFGAYWAKRSERLSARALECKRVRR